MSWPSLSSPQVGTLEFSLDSQPTVHSRQEGPFICPQGPCSRGVRPGDSHWPFYSPDTIPQGRTGNSREAPNSGTLQGLHGQRSLNHTVGVLGGEGAQTHTKTPKVAELQERTTDPWLSLLPDKGSGSLQFKANATATQRKRLP